MTINILNKTKLVKKNINGKIRKCVIFLCFTCEEYIGNEFKKYNIGTNENYVCEDCVPVAELLKRKKTEDKWANLTKKLLELKKKEKKSLKAEKLVNYFESFFITMISKYERLDIRKSFDIKDMWIYNNLITNEEFGIEYYKWIKEKDIIASEYEAILIGKIFVETWWKEIETTQDVFDWIEGTKKINLLKYLIL
jgi:hypothetical protein